MAMKLLTLTLISLSLLSVTFSIVSAAGSSSSSSNTAYHSAAENPENFIEVLPDSKEETESLSDEGSDFVLPRPPHERTCDIYPQMCRRRSSQGPDCCGKRCTNVMKDRFNCGRCERRCRHNELCCRGHCVNPSSDHWNCGGCGKHCKKWETCVYGMCSYA